MVKRISWVLFAAAMGCGGSSPPAAPVYGVPVAATPAQLTSLSIGTNEATSICPGANPPVQLVVWGTAANGARLGTPTSYRGGTAFLEEHGLPWARFRLTANAGQVTPIDFYVPPNNLDLVEKSHVEVYAQDLAQPGLVGAASIPVDFRCGAMLSLRGHNGGDGGMSGSPGASVDVRIGRLLSRAHGQLILARVDSPIGRYYYLLAPGGAPLTIDLRGGDGGAGGAGDRTSIGYAGTNSYGDPVGASISIQAPPGQGGQGGQGGAAVIHVDRTDRLLASAIRVINTGGEGGTPGVNTQGVGAFEHTTARAGQGAAGYAGPMTQVTYDDPSTLFADEIALGYQMEWPGVPGTKAPAPMPKATPARAKAKGASRTKTAGR